MPLFGFLCFPLGACGFAAPGSREPSRFASRPFRLRSLAQRLRSSSPGALGKGARLANNKAPDYRIFAGATEFGAAWKRTARDSDREYLSVKLDDPSFAAPLYASLVRTEGEDDYSLIWSRRSGD